MQRLLQTVCLLGVVWLASVAEAGIDFSSEIQPIFERHCYECHGREERKGGLRLTSREAALTPGDFGVPVITPSSAEASLLVDLISSDDPEERMPHDRDPLAAEQIDLIRRWIDEGAPWPEGVGSEHWAYAPPERPPVPEIGDDPWARTEIDHFVLARLEAEGLRPAPEAEPSALLRRVSFDLTGLPPTPERLEAFLGSPTDAAYERVVDELLDSPRFGEHWAVQWLDAARYADSTGFMSEVELSNWPYRDWVVRAINDDTPFDRFTLAQIAGDLLPGATPADRAATGFHRAAPLNLEAGVREEESRLTQLIDRVNTTASVWLGTTLACAQCHDHKYDPFSQEDYYRLLAFYDRTPKEAVSRDGMGGVNLVPGGPTLQLPHREETRERARMIGEELLASVERRLPASLPGATPVTEEERNQVRAAVTAMDYSGALSAAGAILTDRLAERHGPVWWWPWSRWWDGWLEETRATLAAGEPDWRDVELRSFETTGEGRYRVLDDASVLVEGETPDWVTYTVDVATSLPVTAIRIETMRHPSLPGGGPGRRNPVQSDFVLSEVSVESVGADAVESISLRTALASAHWPKGSPQDVLDGNPRTGWSYLGEARQHDQWIVLALREPLAGGRKVMRLRLAQLAGGGSTLGRFRIRVTSAPPSIVVMPPALQQAVAGAGWEELDPLEQAILLTLARRDVLAEHTPDFDAAREAFDRLPPPPVAHVMVEMEEPRTTRLLERGDIHTPGPVVEAGTPGALPPMKPDQPANRLGLAQWLVADDNPLTARVTVNRWWARLFGRGLVPTLADFGIRGERPSHPELLDWLARELVDQGWSRKRLLRTMVLSSTYRQSVSPADPASLERDPANRLLARSSRLRLPAEAIRDNALQIAGLLSPRMGGPAVAPPQPDGVWRVNGNEPVEYVPSEGEDAYRRGLYTVWRRTAPYPSLVNFDADDRTKCVLERNVSNTPLQALTLLNDEVFHEAALSFADRLVRETPDASPAERLHMAFRLALSRDPEETEIELLTRVLADRRERVERDPAAAESLVSRCPRFRPTEDVATTELASWYAVARILLNLDETIHRG